MKTTEKDLQQTIAVYKNLTGDYCILLRFMGDTDGDFHTGYVRISEPCDVTFAPLKNEAVVRNALKALDGLEHEARMELGEKLGKINEQREQLRSLTYQPEVAA